MNWNQEEEEENRLSLSRFEAMLKTNKIFFFDSEEFENIILHYLDTGKTNLAKKALKLGLEQHPQSTRLRLVQVEILVYENKLDLAERILSELFLIESSNPEVHIQKANIHSKKGEHQKAVVLLLATLKHTDDQSEIYSLIGMEYLFMDELEKAKENFILCLQEDPDDHSSLYNITYCFDLLEEHEEATLFLNMFIEANPYSEVAWHQLGRQYYILEEYDKAVWAFDYAIVIEEFFIGAYIEKAKSLERLKKYNEAINCYNEVLELDDPTWYIFYRMAKCYEKLGNKESAIEFYIKATIEDPMLEKAWLSLIDLFVRDENYLLALHQIQLATDIDPENDKFWKHSASINFLLEQYEEAYIGFENAIKFGTTDLDVFLMFADLNVAYSHNYEKAISVLIEASELHVDHFEIQYRLSGLYFTLNNPNMAKFHLNNALLSNFEHYRLLEKFFPDFYTSELVQTLINKHKSLQ